jgi:transcriptional regulator with XRE-family HTH domain
VKYLSGLIGENVRFYRQRLRLTQQEAAERARMGVRQFQSIEQGRHNATVGTLKGIALALGVDVQKLFISNRIIVPNGIEDLQRVNLNHEGVAIAYGSLNLMMDASRNVRAFTGLARQAFDGQACSALVCKETMTESLRKCEAGLSHLHRVTYNSIFGQVQAKVWSVPCFTERGEWVGGVGLIARPDQPFGTGLLETIQRDWTASLVKHAI